MRKGTAADALRDQTLLAVRDELQAMAVAERTLNIYGGELYRLDEWLDGERLTDELLALYLSKLHVEGKAASTIGTVIAAAKFRAKNAGLACPVGVQAMKTASGIRRAAAAKGGAQQADAIGWEHAERMARMAERTGKTGARSWSCAAARRTRKAPGACSTAGRRQWHGSSAGWRRPESPRVRCFARCARTVPCKKVA